MVNHLNTALQNVQFSLVSGFQILTVFSFNKTKPPCTVHETGLKLFLLIAELHLTNLTYTDAGRYQCVVANKYGATYSDRANITVYVYPTFIVTPEDITVKGGAGASMKCAAQGVPAPTVAWSKDSGSYFPAASERRITYTTFPMGQERRTIVNSFIIRDVKAIDMGVYTCTASNPAGSISWNISLSVLESPRYVTVLFLESSNSVQNKFSSLIFNLPAIRIRLPLVFQSLKNGII